MPYRLICFDAGFTLIAPQQRTETVLGSLLAQQGEHVSAAALQQAGEVARHWFWQEYHRPGNTTWGDDGQIQATWHGFYRRLLAELGLEAAPALIEAAHLAYFQPANWQIYPDVEATLEQLFSQRLILGVVSDWDSRLPRLLAALGLGPLLHFVLPSATAGAAKPTAAFYSMALEEAGVTPDEALMVGDSYHADVLGARAAGMAALLLDRDGTATYSDVPVIRSLAEVVQHV